MSLRGAVGKLKSAVVMRLRARVALSLPHYPGQLVGPPATLPGPFGSQHFLGGSSIHVREPVSIFGPEGALSLESMSSLGAASSTR